MNKLVIIGAGGLGREVAWLVERINKVEQMWEIVGFIDSNKQLEGTVVNNYPVLGNEDWLLEHKSEVFAICAIGNAKIRKSIVERLHGISYATLIDPSVIMSERISIGEGCIICARTIITVDIRIGSHIIVNPACTIGHDSIINDFVTLYPNVSISGNVKLNNCVEIGTGSRIIQGIEIGEGTIVGAGAVVIKDLPANSTAVGVPAKPIKYHI